MVISHSYVSLPEGKMFKKNWGCDRWNLGVRVPGSFCCCLPVGEAWQRYQHGYAWKLTPISFDDFPSYKPCISIYIYIYMLYIYICYIYIYVIYVIYTYMLYIYIHTPFISVYIHDSEAGFPACHFWWSPKTARNLRLRTCAPQSEDPSLPCSSLKPLKGLRPKKLPFDVGNLENMDRNKENILEVPSWKHCSLLPHLFGGLLEGDILQYQTSLRIDG